MEQAKLAATELINAYDNLGDVSVRMVSFSSNATSSFNGKSEWLSADEAKGVIGGFVANGGTNYSGAMTVAKQAFVQGKEAVYYQNGNNVSFFLSDGEPSPGYSAYPVQTDWENFLIANQIQSNALGFGGINYTYALEPLAFDGTKVALTTDDHTPGEIPALVAPNINQLGDILISQAKLSFIENAIGTSFDDKLTGNNLDNELKGNAGNDELKGLGGDDVIRGGDGTDTVLFRGSKSDYEIKREDGYVVFNG
jgi:Ca2+-binding RTX toxin-like protein